QKPASHHEKPDRHGPLPAVQVRHNPRGNLEEEDGQLQGKTGHQQQKGIHLDGPNVIDAGRRRHQRHGKGDDGAIQKVHPIGKRILHPEIPLLVLSEHEGDFHPIQKGTDEPVFIHAPTVSHPPERHSATVFSIGREMGNAAVFIANRKKGTGKKPDLRQVFLLLFTRSRCLVTEHGGQRQSPHFKNTVDIIIHSKRSSGKGKSAALHPPASKSTGSSSSKTTSSGRTRHL